MAKSRFPTWFRRAGKSIIYLDTSALRDAKSTWDSFLGDWQEFTRPKVPASLTAHAAILAWNYGLRGYDAMHLAAALNWQDALETPICLATFDRLLWSAGDKAGISTWPENLIPE